MRSRRSFAVRSLLTAALVTGLAATVPVAAEAAKPKPAKKISIEVLSSRADLVSGGSALVAINLPDRKSAKQVQVSVGDDDVTDQFAFRADGRFEGLVTGLEVGDNVVTAVLGDRGSKITLVNHPTGGPVFSGPQLQPWVCQDGAVDEQCNQPATYTWSYMSSAPGTTKLKPYDPENPPADVKTVKTGAGVTVPFIVRTETGYMNRDQYQVSALFQPDQTWTGVRPQQQFDHKLLVTHGGGCGVEHQTGTAPGTTGSATTDEALAKGFVVMSTSLDNSVHNCNVAVQAESIAMAKEHVIESYGTVRWTIGTGCSGGSLAIQWMANAYPGLYDGLLPTCSFPDAYSTATQFLDYHLLLGYFDGLGGASTWTPAQMNAVLGGSDGIQNARVSEQAQFHAAVPTTACKGVTDAERYDPLTNPGGVRCTIQDAAVNLLGPQEERFWNDDEKALGHGYVRLPVDNVGVQYGLKALLDGAITPAQFVDVNTRVGGVDVDANTVPERIDNGGSASLANAYRTGLINETNNLDTVPIIDCRGPNPGLFHDAYRAFAIRKRLDREHGTHANQLIWEGPGIFKAYAGCELDSFRAVDTWLARVAADHSKRSLARKVIANKPAALTDRCYDGFGTKLSNTLCSQDVVNVNPTPRMVSGDSVATDTNKCRLQPLKRSAYGKVTFTDAEWAQLEDVFATGVCDFSKRGVLQQGTVPWLTYQDATGEVVYGGKPLGAAPVSRAFRP